MKKCMMPVWGVNKHVKSLVMVLLFLLFSSFSAAQTAEGTAGREKPAIVKLIETCEDNFYIQVQLNNDSTKKYILTIQDSDGMLLFRETYQDKSFGKKFLFNKEDMDESLIFTIRKLKDNQVQTFKISYNTHFTGDIVITRLK